MDIDAGVWDDADDALGAELANMTAEEIGRRTRLIENEARVLKDEVKRLTLDANHHKERIKDNQEKIKLNKQLPYLIGNVVEILDINPEDEEEDGANVDLDSQRQGKCVVLKTSTRQTVFLPVVGLVPPDELKPGDLVGVNKDSYLILDTLPAEYDARVKAMEVDEKPTEDYSDIGGLDKQIQELVEAIVLPMTHKERFDALGIRPPKGILLYGPPGTGKTLIARACAAQTNATYLKLAGPQLVQMFIGDGAKLVRDAFFVVQGEGAVHHLHRRGGRHRHQALRQRPQRRPRGAAHYARAAQPAGRLLLRRPHQGDCGDESRGHSGPGADAVGAAGPQDRIPAPHGGGARADHPDPRSQNERQSRRQLRGAGALH